MTFLDCESAGLRGDIFAAALVGENGENLFDGFFRHSAIESNSWLRENVEPNLTGREFSTLLNFQTAFADVWNQQQDKRCVAHMGSPVESNFFQQLFAAGVIGEFDGPYPLLDTAPLLLAKGYDPTSEEAYAKASGWVMPINYKPHSALSDAQLTRLVWNSIV